MENNPPEPFSSAVSERLLEARTIVASGAVSPALAARVTEQLAALAAASDEPVTLMITNLQGGDLASALSLYDVMHNAEPRIQIVAAGQLSRAGLLPLVASPVENRISLPNARFLLHQAKGRPSLAGDVRQQAEEISHLRRRLAELLAQATGQTPEKVKKDLKRGTWLTAQEAKDYGLIDCIVKREKLE